MYNEPSEHLVTVKFRHELYITGVEKCNSAWGTHNFQNVLFALLHTSAVMIIYCLHIVVPLKLISSLYY